MLVAVVGPSAEFVFADVGCQGRISDGGVLRNTVFYHALEAKQLNIPEPKPLPVNEAIVEEWDTLVPHDFVGDEQRVFNYRLSRTRRVSENAFGILSAKFRIFHCTLCVKPKNAISIVHSCLILSSVFIHHSNCCTSYAFIMSLYSLQWGEVSTNVISP